MNRTKVYTALRWLVEDGLSGARVIHTLENGAEYRWWWKDELNARYHRRGGAKINQPLPWNGSSWENYIPAIRIVQFNWGIAR